MWILGSSECLCHSTLGRVNSDYVHAAFQKTELQRDEALACTSLVPGSEDAKLGARCWLLSLVTLYSITPEL